jgi:hypothetical protein
MVDDNTLALGAIGIGGYFAFNAASNVGNTITAPFRFGANTADGAFDFAGETADGVSDAGGEVFGGIMDTADNVGDFGGGITGGAGETINGILAVPGDSIKAGQKAADGLINGAQETVDNLNPF